MVICEVVKPTPHLNYFHVDHLGLFQVSFVQQTKNQIGIYARPCWFLCSPEFGFWFCDWFLYIPHGNDNLHTKWLLIAISLLIYTNKGEYLLHTYQSVKGQMWGKFF